MEQIESVGKFKLASKRGEAMPIYFSINDTDRQTSTLLIDRQQLLVIEELRFSKGLIYAHFSFENNSNNS